MRHLENQKLVNKICERIWTASGSLRGIGSLFLQDHKEICLDSDEFYGIGQLLKTISEELSILEDLIRSGDDSMASVRNGLDNENDDDQDNPLDDELLADQVMPIIKRDLGKQKAQRPSSKERQK